MKALISITEEQLEALNSVVTSGLLYLDDWQAERCPDVQTVHAWFAEARQALVAAQEGQAELQNLSLLPRTVMNTSKSSTSKPFQPRSSAVCPASSAKAGRVLKRETPTLPRGSASRSQTSKRS